MIIAGDIGGTKTVLALFEDTADQELRLLREATFPSQDHVSLESILEHFLAGERPELTFGSFGVAGAVVDGKCTTTNLPWRLEEQTLADAVRAPRVKLLNDLEAAAYGMLYLRPDDFCQLNPEAAYGCVGNRAVIAAGTGLGEAILFWDGERFQPLASEGGHSDFAPRNKLEIEMLEYLIVKFNGHVSYERVLSGPGFFNIYEFLRDSGRHTEPDWLKEQIGKGNPSAAVAQAGVTQREPICVAALDLFASIYGAEAGNLALKCVAVGGVYVGGGIAPKLLMVLQNGAFMRAFKDKGRFAGFMQRIPVSIALNSRTPLIGAANFTRHL